VWSLAFEPLSNMERLSKEGLSVTQESLLEERKRSGPRLLSSSDDQSIRLWRRKPKEGANKAAGQAFPSIIRSTSIEEEWLEDATLPKRHERAVYSIAWSSATGRIVSTGSDGKIIVYEERWKDASEDSGPITEWVVVAEVEGAHDVFEINHVCWTKRRDKGRRNDNEEILISTGDDGEVRLWSLEKP